MPASILHRTCSIIRSVCAFLLLYLCCVMLLFSVSICLYQFSIAPHPTKRTTLRQPSVGLERLLSQSICRDIPLSVYIGHMMTHISTHAQTLNCIGAMACSERVWVSGPNVRVFASVCVYIYSNPHTHTHITDTDTDECRHSGGMLTMSNLRIVLRVCVYV